jgi:putative hemolysin
MNAPLHLGVLAILLIGLPIVCESLTAFPLMLYAVPTSVISATGSNGPRSAATSAMNMSFKSEEYCVQEGGMVSANNQTYQPPASTDILAWLLSR